MLLTTSTRYDQYLARLRFNYHHDLPSPFLLLALHLDRLSQAALAHQWNQAAASLSYDALLDACQAAVASYDGESDALKVRITLSETGQLTATATPIPALRSDPTAASFARPLTDSATLYGHPATLSIDTQPTPVGLLTKTKTTERAVYDEARARAGLPPSPSPDADVLLYNSEEHITEASTSNVAFFRAGQWITPPAESGCLPGVLRRWLLENKRIREAQVGEITKSQMRPNDWVLLFNSVHGCRLARIA
ncbi:aminotransferase [Mycena amicta]|nr:aminotransferase [Mycena amicta]